MLLISSITTALKSVIFWVATLVVSLLNERGPLHALLPFFAIGIAIACLLLCIKVIKSFIWGS